MTNSGNGLSLRSKAAGNRATEIQRLLERRAHGEALEEWFNPAYLSLMKEEGAEAQPQVKALVAYP